ncbi:MAG: hypothetical protein HQ481_05760 [Alphaproteobacteria bacterium]|nr:hypothetical protein [Alphaproteobacteria bacterium]
MGRLIEFRPFPGLPEPARIIYEPEETDLVDPRLRSLYTRWTFDRPEGAAGASRDLVDSDEMRPLARNFMLLEPVARSDGSHDYIYRIYGPDIAQHYGRDMTGKRASDFPAGIAMLFMQLYESAMRNAWPIYSRHAPPKTVKVEYWERLILPLGQDHVSWLLVVNLPIGHRA